MWAEQGPFPTFEGVNVIMYQQSARMVLKVAKKIAAGKTPPEFFSYLVDSEKLLSTPSGATTVAEFLHADHLQRALATRSVYLIKNTVAKLTESKAPSKTKQNELFAIDVNRMARTHIIYIMYERARNNIEKKDLKCANLKANLMTLLANFALKELISEPALLYESGFFQQGSFQLMEGALKQTLIDIRPQMVAIAELLPDASIPSTIGN